MSRASAALWQASRQVRSLLHTQESCYRQFASLHSHTKQQHESRTAGGWSWILPVAAALLPTLGLTANSEARAEDSQSKGWHLLDVSTRRRAFFKYEKRVRDLSSPDKVFQYFATATTPEGVRMMKPADLLCSLVAVYPPESSTAVRSGALPGEHRPSSGQNEPSIKASEFFRLFDVDGDGLISYFEYLLIITFLSIPPQDVHIAFQMYDLDDSGNIDSREFREVTRGLRQRMRKVGHLQRTGFKAGEDDNQGLMETFFGTDGKKRLCLGDFAKFLRNLHNEIVRLEFVHYAGSLQAMMSARDFARCLIAGVETSKADDYIDRVDSMPQDLANLKVSLQDFENFAALRRDVHTLEVALDFYHNSMGHLRIEDFARAAKKITGQDMNPTLIKIVFAMFDTDDDGDLTPRELLQVLRRREGNSAYQQYSMERQDAGASGLFKCLVNCVAGKQDQ